MTAISAKQHREKKAAWKMTPGKFLLYFFMYTFAILCLIPLVWLVRTAFVPKELELKMLAVGWVPTFSNITRIWSMAPCQLPNAWPTRLSVCPSLHPSHQMTRA